MLLTRRRALAGCGGALMVHSHDGNVDYARYQQDRAHEVALRSGEGLCAGRVGRSRSVRFDRSRSRTLSPIPNRGWPMVQPASAVRSISPRRRLVRRPASTSAMCRIAAANRPCSTWSRGIFPSSRGFAAGVIVDPPGQGQSARRDRPKVGGCGARYSGARRKRASRIRVGRVAGCCCAGGHATRDHRRIGKTDRKAPRRSCDEQAVRGNGDRTDRRIDAGRFRRLYQERNRPVGSDCRKVADKTGMTSRVVSSAQGALSWVGPGPPG